MSTHCRKAASGFDKNAGSIFERPNDSMDAGGRAMQRSDVSEQLSRTARRAEDRMSGVIHPREEKFIAILLMKDTTGV